jgi:hypothetical protein
MALLINRIRNWFDDLRIRGIVDCESSSVRNRLLGSSAKGRFLQHGLRHSETPSARKYGILRRYGGTVSCSQKWPARERGGDGVESICSPNRKVQSISM